MEKLAPGDEVLMMRCIELARRATETENYPLGALVALDGQVLAEVSSNLITGKQPSAHPERVAIDAAAEAINRRHVEGAILYTTLEPCAMCTAAAIWAKLGSIVFGALQEDAIAWRSQHPDPKYSWRQIPIKAQAIVAASDRPYTHLKGGVLRQKCTELFRLVCSLGDSCILHNALD